MFNPEKVPDSSRDKSKTPEDVTAYSAADLDREGYLSVSTEIEKSFQNRTRLTPRIGEELDQRFFWALGLTSGGGAVEIVGSGVVAALRAPAMPVIMGVAFLGGASIAVVDNVREWRARRAFLSNSKNVQETIPRK